MSTIVWVLVFAVAAFFGYRLLKKWARRRMESPLPSLLTELAALEADLPHDFLKLARAEAKKKLDDKKRKRVEAIYLEHPELL